ncbi:MAG: M48 family metalloprotease, partial [bacterium]|nr:M48 family metalloprotease [bacterium]
MIHPLEQSWQARYFDGRRPIRHDVILQLGERGIAVREASGEETLWLYRELRQVSGQYEGEQFCFERDGSDPPESIVVEDERFFAALRQHAPAAEQDWGRNTTSIGWPRVILAGLAVAALAAGLYFWGTRMLADVASEVVPVGVEERLGEAVANTLAPEDDRCQSEELQVAVESIVARLAEASSENPYEFRVAIAKDGMVNAFAAPGGYIVVFNGLVERTRSPVEPAGVRAHEMQHVIEQPSTRASIGPMGGRAAL